MKKLTSSKLSEIVGYPVKVNRDVYTIGKSYFYRTGTIASFKEAIENKLNKTEINYQILDSGDCWKTFKGSQNTWQGSHYWVKLEII